MNKYDHYSFRNDMQALDDKRRAERAAADAERREREKRTAHLRGARHWQLRFLIWFTMKVASWGLLIWFLLGQPEIPIRWLQ